MTVDPGAGQPLRLLTYLAPSVPATLFTALADHVGGELGCDVEVSYDSSRSGPRPGEREPFTTGEADVAFLCATSYVWLTGTAHPPIRLVGAAWAPTDPRADQQAVYFGDVLVRVDGPAQLGDLIGRRVAYNDDASLSGYHSVRLALREAGIDAEGVRFVRSGSHLRSLELLVEGDVDAAAIDSTVWHRLSRRTPALAAQVRPIAALGPHPVQPVVARAGLPTHVRDGVRDALLGAHEAPATARALAAAELRRFVPVDDAHYRPLAARMTALDVGWPHAGDDGARLRPSDSDACGATPPPRRRRGARPRR
ncbi:phosphate/phosphite/phosphonate ABC transporter substrate-binding protein [Euzebya sp.]|uniref:phosphate/phosphite/phosphonate ABC transporter substrate-binding protein n=1 Tax=Euzebya sp. TaxID=1971409 RepID=UPI0035123AED